MVTDLVDICARMRAVVEAEPLLLIATEEPFSASRQANLTTDRAYWLDDAGNVNNRSTGNFHAVRIDAIDLAVALRVGIGRSGAREAMAALLIKAERALIADGIQHGYHLAMNGRSVKRVAGREYLVGTLRITVDYDFSEAAV